MRVVVAALLALGITPAAAQQPYPAKPLKMIVPFPPGGPTDVVGRLLAQRLADAWGQNVVIDNRPGGGGMIGANLAAKSPSDGYTLFLGGITTLALAPFLQKNIQYDPLRDFQPVSQTSVQPILLMTHPSLPAKTLKEFIALAKARPGDINYASSGPGGSGHLAGELFRSITHVKIVHVPYRGAPPALTDLMAGQVQSQFGTILITAPLIRAGRIRGIAITGSERSAALPEVPSFPEAGLPTYDASSWNGIVVPAGTGKAIVEKLAVDIARAMRTPAVLDRLAADGSTAVGSTPEQFTQYIKAEQTKWSKVVREAGITID